MRNFFSFSHITAGFISVLVGFTSSAVIVFQSATALGASPEEVSSWLFALGLGIALTCIGLSLRYRMPILTGWSTPGAALLVTSLNGMHMSEAIGAFMFAGLLTMLSGITGLFKRLMTRIPPSLTSAMLAGILFHFGLNVFIAMEDQFMLVCLMLITHLIGKRFFPRYAILAVLCMGIFIATSEKLFHTQGLHLMFAVPVFTMPEWSLRAFVSVGLPLFFVTMTSQNIPGMAVLDASGYKPPISSIVTWTGLITFLLAPFGCYAINLAAISAAICTGKEADANPQHRYRATLFAGLCWLIIALLGSTVVMLFSAFPNALVLAIAGIAMISTIGTSLKHALDKETEREPALITLLVSSSGVSLFGLGSAFWSIIAGTTALFILNWKKTDEFAFNPNLS